MSNILRRAAGRAAARSLMEGNETEDDAVDTGTEENAEDDTGTEDDGDMEGEDDAPDASESEGDGEQAQAANQSATQAAALAATNRCAAIITSKEGMANPALANKLAFNADAETGAFMSAKSAIAILADAPAASKGGRLNGLMAGHAKTPGADAPNADNGDTSMNAMMKRRNAEHANG